MQARVRRQGGESIVEVAVLYSCAYLIDRIREGRAMEGNARRTMASWPQNREGGGEWWPRGGRTMIIFNHPRKPDINIFFNLWINPY